MFIGLMSVVAGTTIISTRIGPDHLDKRPKDGVLDLKAEPNLDNIYAHR